MKHWFDNILRLLHLPSIDVINKQRELNGRISEIQARIRKLKTDKEALQQKELGLTIPQPPATTENTPRLFVPEEAGELPSLVERRRAGHTLQRDAIETLVLRIENRIRQGKISAARANLGAMEELLTGTAEEEELRGIIEQVKRLLS